ncbi:MAG: PD-(D/E)XK nuclease family protein, partial [Microcoleaceae cyanobacterium]
CVVGDDDQGLYRFRGATIRNILEFGEQFNDCQCERVELVTNYRSHPGIIEFYNRWMADQNWHHNSQCFRYQKEIKPRPDEFPDVPTVLKVSAANELTWHEEVLTFLHALRDKGTLTDWNQVAFLFYSVKSDKAKGLAEFLENNGINVYAPRSNQFFEREEVKLMFGALIFLFPQFEQIRKWSDDANLEIWEYYDTECYEPFCEQLRLPENSSLQRWCAKTAKKHLNLIENTNYGFTGLFYELLQFPLFSRYLEPNLLQNKAVINSRPMRNLALFSEFLGKFEYLNSINNVLSPQYLDKHIRDFFNQFCRYVKDGGLHEYEDEAEYAPTGCVSFLTIHQSKGLEFPVVIVGSLHTVPKKSYDDLTVVLENNYCEREPFEPIEEVKKYDFYRLFYTAYSRAQNLLVLSSDVKQGRGKTPSKYFDSYFNSLPEWDDPTVRLGDIHLEQVKDVNIRRQYSFTSHLTLYENCAEQYRFYKELEFAPIRTSPILFGTLVHQTIEDIHRTVLRREEHKLSEDQVATWFDINYVYLTKHSRVYLAPAAKNSALGHVLNYYRRRNGDWSCIKEAEVDVSLVKDEYILKGSVDLIEGANGTVEIIDFKSEKKLDVNNPKDQEKLNRYRRQLEVYAHIVEERQGVKVSKTHLYYTAVEDENPCISFDVNPQSINETIQAFDQVVHRIEQKDFAMVERPLEKVCKNCDMKSYCDQKSWQKQA